MQDRFWGKATRALLYMKNLLPKIQLQGKCPYVLFKRRAKPLLPGFSFGQGIVYRQPRMKREKLDPPGQQGRYLCCAMSQIAHSVPGTHRVWCLATDDVVIVPHVKPYGVCAMLLPISVGRGCMVWCGGRMGPSRVRDLTQAAALRCTHGSRGIMLT